MMINNYTFLTDHSYSLRPVNDDDNEELSLNKKKKTSSRRSSNRMNITNRKKTISIKTNRTVSIDRSSSDKENNSISNHSISKSKRTASVQSRKKLTTKKMPVKKMVGAIVKKTTPTQHIELFDAPPSLSIEERVKLRRTKALPPSTTILPKQSQISTKKISKTPVIKKSTKFFLGSGLDLDNIVSGNRQRRSVQT